jgi:predicted HTH domain antitoxin
MNILTLQMPDTFQMDQKETLRFLAAKLYESGKLSLGQAAEVVNLSKSEFAEILTDYDVSLINYSLEDVIRDAGKI